MNKALVAAALGAFCMMPLSSRAQELRAPAGAIAGSEVAIGTSGNGNGTFYLIGPGTALKREVQFGQEVKLPPRDVRHAGVYRAVACTDECRSVTFHVSAAKPASLSFLVHPSRAPVALGDVISGVALPFDEFSNLVVSPTKVSFQLNAKDKTIMSQSATTQSGVAWFRAASGRSAEAVQVVAQVDDVSARRVVQQVASDPCSLRIKGQRTAKGITVETEPVRDCTGNPVPDGTIVTFTAKHGKDISTVDAPIKQGIARAQMIAPGPVVVSAASGVVMGNELRLGAQP